MEKIKGILLDIFCLLLHISSCQCRGSLRNGKSNQSGQNRQIQNRESLGAKLYNIKESNNLIYDFRNISNLKAFKEIHQEAYHL
jgi:hypothetical protein